MKRFYKSVDIAKDDGWLAVLLDGRPVKTPARNLLRLPNRDLARAVGDEWAEQQETVDPRTMRLTRLANTAIDRVASQRPAVVDEIARYAETDLVCYRAAEPPELAQRQVESWDPLVEWMRGRHGVALAVTDSLLPAPQDAAALQRARAAVGTFDDFRLAGIHTVASACGSVVLALAVADRRLGGEAAWELSLIDETWQIERWGEDAEVTRRRAGLLADVTAAATFLSLCARDE